MQVTALRQELPGPEAISEAGRLQMTHHQKMLANAAAEGLKTLQVPQVAGPHGFCLARQVVLACPCRYLLLSLTCPCDDAAKITIFQDHMHECYICHASLASLHCMSD